MGESSDKCGTVKVIVSNNLSIQIRSDSNQKGSGVTSALLSPLAKEAMHCLLFISITHSQKRRRKGKGSQAELIRSNQLLQFHISLLVKQTEALDVTSPLTV